MLTTRTILALAPTLRFSWSEGASDGFILCASGRPLTHKIARSATPGYPRELLTDLKTRFLVGFNGSFKSISTAKSLTDLETALVRLHLLDMIEGPRSQLFAKSQMLDIVDPEGFATTLATHLNRPIPTKPLSLERAIFLILSCHKSPHLL